MSPPQTLKEDIRRWWAGSPMTYAETHGDVEYVLPDGSVERVQRGTRRFFELADQRFYGWNTPLHTEAGPFGHIFDYAGYAGKAVLEVGCGMGAMAMNWAQRGAQVTAVDLNPVAIEETRKRFATFGLPGVVEQADAEALPFPDASFDFVYSWGVLHHTPGTEAAIAEIFRVLKPQGRAGVMLYNRNSLLYRYMIFWREGLVNMERRFLDPLGLASRYTDGGAQEGNPHTWPVTPREIRRTFERNFTNVETTILGTDVPPILDTWWPQLAGKALPEALKRALARRIGWSIWTTGAKP